MQGNAGRCIALHYSSALQIISAVQCTAMPCRGVQWRAVPCIVVQCGGTEQAHIELALYQSTQSWLGGHYWAYMPVYNIMV